MDDLVAFLVQKFERTDTGKVRKIDSQTVVLYDLVRWDGETRHDILQHFPLCDFDNEYTENSVSGFIVIIRYSPMSFKTIAFTVLYLVLVGVILHLIYCVK